MKYLTTKIDDDHAYILCIGDVHIGDPSFEKSLYGQKSGRSKLEGYLKWAKEHLNTRIFLNGDIFNVGGRNEKTSPFETDNAEYEKAVDIFKPYASQIIGAVDGNHEARIIDEFGYSPLAPFCHELKIPYCKWSAVVRLQVGKRKNAGDRYEQNYFLYFHHTTGGGGALGNKINRVEKLRDIVEGIDVYFGSHNHQLISAPIEVFYPSIQGGIRKRRILFVDSGSFVSWGENYAEEKMYPPTKTGAPRVRFSGVKDKHDVFVSI